jgi:hypothetical protein
MMIGVKCGLTIFSVVFAASPLARVPTFLNAAQNDPMQLSFPVACEVGKSCLIQKLVDHDFSDQRRDYRCGNLTTDGHDGVDIRLRTMDDMRSGFVVTASAAGTVLRMRDGEPDMSSRERKDLNGRDAGNGVVIDHGNGWETQYSHLRQGSVAVKPGQRIAAGQQLGLVGMSGNAEFPHLHFTVRHDGKAIDPFTGAAQGSACSTLEPTTGLWLLGDRRTFGYVPTAVISLGLASAVPPKAVAARTSEQPLNGRQSLQIDRV